MPSQAKGRKTVLGKIFTYAIREGLIAASPVPPIELIPHHSKLRDEDGEPIVFEPEQVHRLLELAKTFDEQGRGKYGPNRNLRVYPLLAVALGMGLRTGEILGLRWKNFDPRDNTLSIEKSVTYLIDTGKRIEKAPKTKGSRRILPMPKWVAGLTPFRRSSRYESRPVARGRGQGDWSDHDEQQEASHPGAGRP